MIESYGLGYEILLLPVSEIKDCKISIIKSELEDINEYFYY